MADQCTPTEEPPPPPPPIETSRSIWEPGGDPAALRAAAAAWRSLAGTLGETASAIDAGATTLGERWTGEAADAFAAYWSGLRGSLEEGVTHAEGVADTLEQIADEIERVNHEVHQLYLAIAATAAVSIAAAFVTFGLSTAAGAAAAAANVARATTLVNGLATFLRSMQVGFSIARFGAFWRTWAIGASAAAVGTGAGKAAFGQNPLDSDSWQLRDATAIVVSANLGGAATVAMPGRPVLAGALGNGSAAVTTDVWLNGDDLLSWQVLADGVIGAGTGGLASGVTAGVTRRLPTRPPTLSPPRTEPLVVVRSSGTATSVDDLWLPGRPPQPQPRPPAPAEDGPLLWLPGESAPRHILPGTPDPAAVGAVEGAGSVGAESSGAIGQGLVPERGGDGPITYAPFPEVACLSAPPPPLVGAGR